MRGLRPEIDIDASAEHVWAALTDFAAFPEWNPFIRRIEGMLAVGSRLEVSLGASGTKPMTFRPTVLRVDPNRELRWLGRVGHRLHDHCYDARGANGKFLRDSRRQSE